MKVTITTAGHTVEIQSDEDDMNVHRLANIAVNTWKRTKDAGMTDAWGASGYDSERRGQRIGFTWSMGAGDQLEVR